MRNRDFKAMRCKKLFALLSEFIDGQLDQKLCREIRRHISGCNPCKVSLKTLQKTVDICKGLPTESLPEKAKRELRETLAAELTGWKLRAHKKTR